MPVLGRRPQPHSTSQICHHAPGTKRAPTWIVLWRRREISTTVPVAYCTLLTATTDVLLSIASMSVSVKSHVGWSSTKRTVWSFIAARRSHGRVIAGKSDETARIVLFSLG